MTRSRRYLPSKTSGSIPACASLRAVGLAGALRAVMVVLDLENGRFRQAFRRILRAAMSEQLPVLMRIRPSGEEISGLSSIPDDADRPWGVGRTDPKPR